MKLSPAQYLKNREGFTLIELIVVIAIIGILAVGLLFTIDPLDKINSANDASVIQTITQLGQANDSYAATHENKYAPGANIGAVVTNLNSSGEIKFSSLTPPSKYTYNYKTTASCDNNTTDCANYVFWVNLRSKAYSSNPFFMYANGKACKVATAPTTETVTCP